MQMILLLVPPLLMFICLYAGTMKLAARLLRYTLSWKLSFVFAITMLIIAIASRAVQFAIGHSLPLWLALILLLAVYVALGAWLFAERDQCFGPGSWLARRCSTFHMRLLADGRFRASAVGTFVFIT